MGYATKNTLCINMAYSSTSVFYKFYKTVFQLMEGATVGILLFGLLIYGSITDFDDGNGHNRFN